MNTPMNTMAHKIKVFLSASTLTMVTLYSPLNYAGPGNLADTPLFLANSVQPNIAFMVDDSGSMDWESLLNQGTEFPGGSAGSNLDETPDNTFERRMVCRGFNVQAYDPTVQYTPWSGTDSAGNDYPNMTLANARPNPYNTATENISNHVYFVWNDMDGDGEYDGPGSTDINAAADPSDECGDVSSNANGVAVSSLSASDQQNYANWWSYYRKREYVVKRALSQIIVESNARIGLGVINDNDDSDSSKVLDVDDISLPLNATARTNKNNLLTNLFTINSSGGTPLRTGLERVGEYFEGDNGNWGNSPILSAAQGGECQHNFGIIMSDGFWNGGNPSVGNADTDNNTNFDGASYADENADVSNTLADVAMHYYERDLSGLDNEVPRTPFDPDPTGLAGNTMHQHMKTFTVAFGLNGTLSANPPNRTDPFAWPTPSANNLTTVDDMRHAAWNGRGDFLNAGDPQQLIDSLNSTIGTISAITGSAASVAFNTSSLSANSEIYLALLNSDSWSGDLLSFALDPVTGDISNSPTWSAGTVLTDRNLALQDRTILSYSSTTADGIPFQWASLDNAQKDDLRTNSDGGVADDAVALARLQYLRGDRSCEPNSGVACSVALGGNIYNAKNLRERTSRLGDIVHSGPVFVGAPGFSWPDTLHQSFGTTPYSNFRVAQANRSGVIYIGSNDGMLHGFDEATGEELLAYVPGFLSSTAVNSGLHYLTYQEYAHQYYVDLTPSVSDVFIKSYVGESEDKWKTILVGAARGGGRGIFALDITTPSFSESASAPANTVLWEFSSADDADLGYTFSQPSVVPLDNGEWAAIFGNGYNDTGSGEASLFIVFLEGGIDGDWTDTGDYIKISTGVGSTANRNGLASPAVIDSDGNGTADRVYAGDLEGNMWVFDISGSNTNQWNVAYKQGSTPRPLFTSPANSPITTAPVIVRNPDIPTSGREPNTIVLFGTGQYLTTADVTSTAPLQAFYGVWDNGNDQQLTQSDLVEQTIGTGTTSDGTAGRTLTSNTVSYASGDNGWFMTLPVPGERSVTEAIVRGERVIFVTTIPNADPCGSGGDSYLMVADFNDGSSPDEAAFDINRNGLVGSDDEINGDGAAGIAISGIGTSPRAHANQVAIATTDNSGGGTSPSDIIDNFQFEDLGSLNAGRLSWEELAR